MVLLYNEIPIILHYNTLIICYFEQRVQLNKLSEKDVADAKMASVFGDTTSSTKTPLRVNPLYDKNGTVEVNASELRRKRLGSESGSTTNGSVTRLNQQPNGSVHTVSQVGLLLIFSKFKFYFTHSIGRDNRRKSR